MDIFVEVTIPERTLTKTRACIDRCISQYFSNTIHICYPANVATHLLMEANLVVKVADRLSFRQRHGSRV